MYEQKNNCAVFSFSPSTLLTAIANLWVAVKSHWATKITAKIIYVVGFLLSWVVVGGGWVAIIIAKPVVFLVFWVAEKAIIYAVKISVFASKIAVKVSVFLAKMAWAYPTIVMVLSLPVVIAVAMAYSLDFEPIIIGYCVAFIFSFFKIAVMWTFDRPVIQQKIVK